MLVFEQKRSVLYVAMDLINRLEWIGVISKVQCAEWAAPTVYIKKTNKYTCPHFLAGLNECLKTYEYMLPNAEDNFAKLNCGKVFSKLDFPMHTYKLWSMKKLIGIYIVLTINFWGVK